MEPQKKIGNIFLALAVILVAGFLLYSLAQTSFIGSAIQHGDGTLAKPKLETIPVPPEPIPPTPSVLDVPLDPNVCCTTSEYNLCHDGVDNDCDTLTDERDTDCCPDDYNPCTKAVLSNGQCANQPVIDCQSCRNELDCFDGKNETTDYCFSGKCTWVSR